jgi:hypothetical protein
MVHTNNNKMTKTKQKHNNSNDRNRGSTLNGYYVCPNKLRNLTMTSLIGWSNHYLHYLEWFKVSSGSSEFGPNVQQSQGVQFRTRKDHTKFQHQPP